jgi:hypothetical protein
MLLVCGLQAQAESLHLSLDVEPVSAVTAADGFTDVRGGTGTWLSADPGKPGLPQRTVTYALPPDADLQSMVVSVATASYHTVRLDAPVRPAAPWQTAENGDLFFGDAKHVVNGMDADVYSSDSVYPESPVRLEGVSQLRRWKLARIIVNPVLYNPEQQSLRQYSRIAFSISFKRDSTTRSDALTADTVMDLRAQAVIANADEAAAWYPDSRQGMETGITSGEVFVVMTTDQIFNESTNLFGLVEHKRALGYTVHTVTETTVDGSAAATGWNEVTGQSPNGKADRMRKWLQDNYVSMDIKYLLLVGNPNPAANELPMKELHYQAYVYPVDCYFSDMTGNWDIDGNGLFGNETNDVELAGGVDLSPEFYVGRIPVYTSDAQWPHILRSILLKSMKYELEPNINWRRSGLLPESFSNADTDGAYLAEHTRDNILSPKGYSAYTLYEQGSVNTNYDSVFTSDEELLDDATVQHWMNESYGMVLWWAHGWSRGASVYAAGNLFTSAQCPMLDNEHPAVLFMSSCSCGQPSDSYNISYAMLRDGGIASVAAGQVSWFYSCQWSPAEAKGHNASMGYDFMRKVISNGVSFGQALAEVKDEAIGWWNNRYTFSLYGDPSLYITSQGEDSDSDGMPDRWETRNGLTVSAADAQGNPDGDNYTNIEEYHAGLNPQIADNPDTDLTSLSVAGTFNSWNPEANNMNLVADFTWEGFLVLTNTANAEFKFAGDGSWDTNWGDDNQLVTNSSMAGIGELAGANIAVGGTLDGRYRFTFNELTQGYRIEPAPDIDSDSDGMPDTWENTYGLDPLVNDANGNPDHDVYSNLEEYQNGTSPTAYDAPRSSYGNITVAGTFNGWDQTLTNMCLVDDYTWRLDTAITNVVSIQFKFTADGSWTVNWGDNDQGETGVPQNNVAESGGANIQASAVFDGIYRFTFNEQTRNYSLSSVAASDTDNDGMNDEWERENGLSPRNSLDAWDDDDGDGLTNGKECELNGSPDSVDSDGDGAGDFDEAIAGTALNDAGEHFSAASICSPTNLTLSWPGSTGRVYDVYRATGPLSAPAWQPVPGCTNLPGADGNMGVDLGERAAEYEFYKVRVTR